jgi:uncharacterized protein involved in exopolysaccharide biosynthesis
MADVNGNNRMPIEAAPQAPQIRQVTVREFYTVLFVHKWTIIISFMVMLAAIFWGLSLRERQYIASVKFYVNRSVQQQASLRYIGNRDWEEHINSISEIGRSQGVLRNAAIEYDALRGWSDPPIWRTQQISAGMETMVEVSPVPETAIINILIKDTAPDTALIIAEIYGRNFANEVRNISRQSESRLFFQNAITEVESKIAAAQEAKAALQTETQLTNWEHEQMALQESIQILTRDLTSKRADREMLQSQVEFEKKALREGDESFLTAVLRSDEFLKHLKFKINEMKLELANLATRYTPDHRSVVAKRNEIAAAETELAVVLNQAVAEHDQRLKELIAAEQVVAKQITEMQERLDSIPASAAQISYYDSYISSQWRLYGELITKYNDTMASDESTLLEHQVVQLGTPNIGGIVGETQKAVYMVIAPVFALLLAVSIAFMVEAADHTFQKSAELEEYSGLPVLAIFRKI